jgi:hypothetical protein
MNRSIVEVNFGDPSVIFTFPVDDYRSTLSFRAFLYGRGKSFISAEKYYNCHSSINPHRLENVPEVKLDNIWEFYKTIGYNYKKRKYEN